MERHGGSTSLRVQDNSAGGNLTGTVVDRYRIGTLIGSGGLASVYRATHLVTEQEVAFKILHAELVGVRGMVERMRRECVVTARVRDRNVVICHDAGTYDGRPWLILDLLQGETLRHKMRFSGRRLWPHEALSFCRQVANGLVAVHKLGIVHRDLKPENLFVVDGKVLIIDFGFSRHVDDGPLTDPDAVPGSPSYMAPEQFTHGVVDGRTDMYALGVILYELLRGEHPYVADDGCLADSSTIVWGHLHGTATPLTKAFPGFPLSIANIVERCLAKDPKNRYQTARGLAADLADAEMNLTERYPCSQFLQPMELFHYWKEEAAVDVRYEAAKRADSSDPVGLPVVPVPVVSPLVAILSEAEALTESMLANDAEEGGDGRSDEQAPPAEEAFSEKESEWFDGDPSRFITDSTPPNGAIDGGTARGDASPATHAKSGPEAALVMPPGGFRSQDAYADRRPAGYTTRESLSEINASLRRIVDGSFAPRRQSTTPWKVTAAASMLSAAAMAALHVLPASSTAAEDLTAPATEAAIAPAERATTDEVGRSISISAESLGGFGAPQSCSVPVVVSRFPMAAVTEVENAPALARTETTQATRWTPAPPVATARSTAEPRVTATTGTAPDARIVPPPIASSPGSTKSSRVVARAPAAPNAPGSTERRSPGSGSRGASARPRTDEVLVNPFADRASWETLGQPLPRPSQARTTSDAATRPLAPRFDTRPKTTGAPPLAALTPAVSFRVEKPVPVSNVPKSTAETPGRLGSARF